MRKKKKMNKLLSLFVLIVASSAALAQNSESALERNAGFHKLSFEIELIKKNYLPLEPLFVKFRLVNQTNAPLAADRPQFLLDSRLKVLNPKGKVREVTSLSLNTNRTLPLPGLTPVLQPLGSYEEETMLGINPDIFAEPGHYKLRFTLYGDSKSLESNEVDLTTEHPEGIDREALAFLTRYGKDVWFGRVFLDEADAELLKTFVGQYGASNYGGYAILSLGRYYSYKGKFDEAKAEFEKLESSSNNFLVKQAKKDLADNAKRKADRAKREQPK